VLVAARWITPVFLALSLSGGVFADVVVTRLDSAKPVRGISLEVQRGRLSVQTAAGKLVEIATTEVVEVIALPPPKPPEAVLRPFEVRLLDGSRVRGELTAAPDDQLRLRCPALAAGRNVLTIPIEEILDVRRVAGAEVPGASRLVRVKDNDAAYRLDGARITGTLESFGEDGAHIDRGDLGARTIPYGQLAALFIDNEPGKAPAGLFAVAHTHDGSAFVLQKDFRIAKGALSGKTPSGLQIHVPTAQLVALGFRGGRFEHLSDRKPQTVARTPFFPLPDGPAKSVMLDFVCPIRIDRSPDSRPITLHGRRYFKGLGVRPTTTLTWKLDGTFKRFEALCGIDDEVLGPGYGRGGGTGSVIFVVLVDGKEAWRSDIARGGAEPVRAQVDLEGARSLTLKVIVVPADKMPGGRKDSTELDNAVWARPLLVR